MMVTRQYTNQNDDYLKKHCKSELHSLTITLVNLYNLAPAISRVGGIGEGDILQLIK